MKGKTKYSLLIVSAVVGGVLLLAIAVLTAVILYMQSVKPQPLYTGPIENIRTGYIGEYAGLILVAENQGYFKKYGLTVTLQQYTSGPESLNALTAGQVDTAVASDFAGVSNSFQNQNLRLVSIISKAQAFFMVGRKDHGITNDITSLKGKKVGITQKTVGEFYLGQFLTLNALSTRDIEIINMPQAQLVTALSKGTIDAAALFQPNSSKAAAALGEQAVTRSIQSRQNINSILFSTASYTSQHSDALKRYLKALVEAEEFIKTNPTAARTIITDKLGYSSTYINSIWPDFSFETSLDEELLLNMEDEARWSIENHLTTTTTVPNYLRQLYFDALEAAKPESITVIR